MKTLVIVSHPEIGESSSQQYLLHSLPDTENVTLHHLEAEYPDGLIDVKREQELLKAFDRILFQFPFYWYSSPPMLKKWQDEVLEEHFAYGFRGDKLKGKEFGLILVIGNPEKEYQTGGTEGFSLSELTTPYQAVAKKTQMTYLKPLAIYQFPYMKEAERMDLLVTYQQWLTMENPDSLKAREKWICHELEDTSFETLPEGAEFILDQAIERIEENRMELDELRMHIDNHEE
jgi:putative NADPH-quinone reductase